MIKGWGLLLAASYAFFFFPGSLIPVPVTNKSPVWGLLANEIRINNSKKCHLW